MRSTLIFRRLVLAVLLATVAASQPAVAADAPFDIVITVDDLPLQGKLSPDMTQTSIVTTYLAALKAHKVPEAYGFINAAKLKDNPEGERVLDAWQAANYPLGNHGLTHMNLGRADSLEAWIADIKANEPFLTARVKDDSWRVIRMPNLSGGGIGERHDGAIAFLKSGNYRLAEVTVSFSDWAYTDAYARCVAKGDAASIAAMEAEYLRQVDQEIVRMKALSQKVYGRVIPQILLTHLGTWGARTLPQVLARLEAAGARYVPLSAALSDRAYVEEPDSDAGNSTMMERVAKRKGIDIKDLPSPPSTLNLATICG